MTAAVAPVATIRGGLDRDGATSLLTGFAVVLCAVPASYAIAGAGSFVTLPLLVGVTCSAAWAARQTIEERFGVGPQPVRVVLVAYLVSTLLSFAAASGRAATGAEASAADRGVVVAVSLVGVALLTADGVRSRQRLDHLLRALVVLGAGVATVGILQFLFGYDVTASLRLPLLTPRETGYEAITARSGFNRVAGTTLHPIEFSVVLTMLLPVAVHVAHHAGLRRWWAPVALLAAAIPMSVSRTGTVGVIAVGLLTIPTWSPTRRRRAAVAGAAFLLSMKLVFPGLIGSIRALFTGFADDPSIASREHDYSYIGTYIAERPWFGRGAMTFLPDHFDFVDNQYLLSLVETGVVGLLALLAVFFVGMGAARGARHRSTDPVTRDLGQALAASLIVGPVTFATFDFMSFPVARGLSFLLVGCAGALWRFECHRPHPLRAAAVHQ